MRITEINPNLGGMSRLLDPSKDSGRKLVAEIVSMIENGKEVRIIWQ